ncbi:MAG: hypothetical protein COU63_00420 [Candidatus Pacebacteria bacterium CG10_big_fil_rev_8_21_14_0_10_36_11]|nr:hypothetical protein [Candidatus Pacearchaeota archaeon]OIP74496.1 MAG: hypothetical protein AUK08_00015 [Candidatus Pacebacteria bacterium CG2_30_36_39]PIR65121.1 MAG: hypothetical protein COU63_00420 [Candidatus Pacebacteria bacterium CG10_big_fil_rev_8_21_14_0_10_36_11]PJC42676.1 MAG: hypothetical protein CO040_03310 [Candidatus Pacebacteria bacterium CG_4_9_14_0_2_um_filter_36_8]
MRFNLIKNNIILGWIFFGSILLLFIPFLFMQFLVPLYDPENKFKIINWDFFDFLVMGVLIFVTANLFVVIAKKIQRTSHRILVAMGLLLAFFWLWAELAVGIFTNWGS